MNRCTVNIILLVVITTIIIIAIILVVVKNCHLLEEFFWLEAREHFPLES